MRKQNIATATLIAAVDEIESGIVDASLGGGLVKRRIWRVGAGKRGGYRAILAVHVGRRIFFLYGFAKSAKSNLDPDELEDFKRIGKILLQCDESHVRSLVQSNELFQIR
ncbi:MAG: type II toxin-antitoxin system RelE/ParE family toxin [Alphaproteobacteria bacterium]|nr:type II toxin-antitoxin system RelE/ParE family toxin [Alphaproteobacteria bacterium]